MRKQFVEYYERDALEPWIDKDVWSPEEAALFLALTMPISLSALREKVQAEDPLPPCLTLDADMPDPSPAWIDLWDKEEAYHTTLELTRSALMPGSDHAPKRPLQWLEWGRSKGFEVRHLECHLTPPGVAHDGGQVDAEVDTHPEKKFCNPAQNIRPDNRIHTTQDRSRTTEMRALVSKLFDEIGDRSDSIWKRLCELAGSEDGRNKYPFLIGSNGQWVEHVQYKKVAVMKRRDFTSLLSAIRKSKQTDRS